MAFVIVGSTYSARSSIGPLSIGIPCAILLTIQIILENRKNRKPEKKNLEDVGEDTGEGKVQSYLSMILWSLGLLFCTFFFGIVITFPLFVFAYIRCRGISWVISLSVALGVFITIYGGFVFILKTQLYKGLLFGEIPIL